MPYQILPENLHSTADAVGAYLVHEYGLKKLRNETSLDDQVRWRPTLTGDTQDHHIVCVEVTDAGFSTSLHEAILEIFSVGLPVKLYIAYPADNGDSKKMLSTFKKATERGIGLIEVSANRRCRIVSAALELSLTSVRRVDSRRLKSKYRQAFKDAEHTFRHGDPVKGCARVYDEIEALSRIVAGKLKKKKVWNKPTRIDVEKGPWSTIMTSLQKDVDKTELRKICPDCDDSLLARVGGLTTLRNQFGHKVRNQKKLIERDRRLRTNFEHACDVFIEFQDAMKPLRP